MKTNSNNSNTETGIIDIVDTAHYFLSLSRPGSMRVITHDKLEKLLYFTI